MTSSRADTTLTVQEIEAAHLASFDLGPGYPQLAAPDYVKQLYLDDRIEELSLHFAPFWTPDKQALVDAELQTSITGFLSLPLGRYDALRATFSGSIALDRALTAVLNEARAQGADGLDVITTTPSIDIMRLFLEERTAIYPVFVRSCLGGTMGALDVDAIVGELRQAGKRGAGRKQLVLLTSPENPTGSFWSREDLKHIAVACAELDAALLVDHTFLVSGVQLDEIPRVWDAAPKGLDWIAVWDTGKTFGLNEDKLGFLFTGSSRMTLALDQAIAVMQFGVARRQKLFFAELVKRAVFYDHLKGLRDVCQTNLTRLCEMTDSSAVRPRVPPATSMVLLDCEALQRSDEEIRQRLLSAQVGVIAGNVFFHDEWRPRNYVRLALARDPDHFEAAIETLLRELKPWQRRSKRGSGTTAAAK